MTDLADQETLQLADEIRRTQTKNNEDIQKNIEQEWYKSKVGRYYQEAFMGAHEEAFKVFYVRDIDWCHYLKTDYIMFAHIGYFGMGVGSISYSKQEVWRFDDEYYKEITELEFLDYLNKFLKLTGWKGKLEEETNH